MRYITLILAMLAAPLAKAQHSRNSDYELQRGLEIFNDITRQLDMYYVDTLSLDTAIRWAIDGMLQRVDPFTSYYPGDDMGELKQMATGKYGGIGSLIRYRRSDKRCCISEPYEDTPAQEAGLRKGDMIMSIDGKDVDGMLTPAVSNLLRGDAGTTFELVVRRQGKDIKHKITRRNIQMPQVPFYGLVADSTGYIQLTGFTEGAAAEVRRALAELKKQGISRLVFDLRSNPGGSLEEAVNIVSLFVPHGSLVVSTKGKIAATCREMHTQAEPLLPDMPVCVLVDDNTASSAEIVSGTLQDMDRAVIIGQRTFGKGLVQSVREAPYDGSLKITTSRYYIPSGRCIQAYDYRHLNPDGSVGIVPDSVTHVFKTAGGREVRDGGGIKPDVVMVPDSFPTFIYDLVEADVFDDWCIEYVYSHESIAPARDFHLTEEEWDSFKKKIEASGFKCRRRSTDFLKRLREVARLEGYEKEAAEALKTLEGVFDGSITADMERFREELARYLENEIVRAYYYQRGGVEHLLRSDKVLERAKEILDTDEYNTILKP